MKFLRFPALWLLLFSLCIAVRLPHFLSDVFFLDHDEATIGIMAKDVLKGGRLPYYFYFQNYGFSTVETLVTTVFIKIFGAGIWALKLGALFLYSLGCAFIVRFLIERRASLFVLAYTTIIAVAFPSWIIWGSLMRGGYLTSFVCAMAVLYLTQTKTNSYLNVCLAGLLFFVGFESNLVIFMPVFFLLLHWLWSRRFEYKKWLLFAVCFAVPLLIAKQLFTDPYLGVIHMDFSPRQVFGSLDAFLGYWQESFTGFHSFTVLFPIPKYWETGSLVLALVFLWLIVTGMVSRSSRIPVSLVLAGTIASLVLSCTALSFAPRYGLGFYTGILVLVVLVAAYGTARLQPVLLSGAALLTFVGITVGSKIGEHWLLTPGNERREMADLYKRVRQRKIAGLYCVDRTFVWDYLYGDDVPATYIGGFDRSPQFADRVAKLEAAGKKIGLMGNAGFQGDIKADPSEPDTFYVSKKYYLLEHVDDSLLTRLKEKFRPQW